MQLQTISCKIGGGMTWRMEIKLTLTPLPEYPVLADIDMCLVFVLSVKQGVELVSVKEFTTLSSNLSLGIGVQASRRSQCSGSTLCSPSLCKSVSHPNLRPSPPSSHHDQPLHPTTNAKKIASSISMLSPVQFQLPLHARPDLVMEESIIPLSPSPPPCQTDSSSSLKS